MHSSVDIELINIANSQDIFTFTEGPWTPTLGSRVSLKWINKSVLISLSHAEFMELFIFTVNLFLLCLSLALQINTPN